ncbi:MAG: N-acetylmuramoyl-L-alanine amidase [Bacteroidales bacterium]
MRKVNKIILHCTATPEGREVKVSEIREWHRANGYNDIGYHYVILLDGSVGRGREEEVIGAHCQGHNANSIGIAYVGGIDAKGKPKNTLNTVQNDKLKKLVIELLEAYPNATVHGHNEFSNKDCPCFDVQEWRKQLKK